MSAGKRKCAKAKRPACSPRKPRCPPSRSRKAKKPKRINLPPVPCPVHETNSRAPDSVKKCQGKSRSQAAHSKPCVLNRIVNYIVSKTIRCRSSGSNSSNSARMSLQRLTCHNRQAVLSPRTRVEMDFIIRHLKLIAREESMEGGHWGSIFLFHYPFSEICLLTIQ